MRQRTERLTDDLYRRLSGADAESLSRLAIVVCTVDADGWPHPAMLSYFEVAAIDPDNLLLAVYNDSRTSANMRAQGTATLVIVDAGLVCYVRGRVSEVAPAMSTAPYNAVVNLRIDQVVFDEPPPDLEPGAFVTSGITYRPRTGAALDRARAVLKELRAVRPA
jgi:Pyridoxamine 5'-phosphate oxidase